MGGMPGGMGGMPGGMGGMPGGMGGMPGGMGGMEVSQCCTQNFSCQVSIYLSC